MKTLSQYRAEARATLKGNWTSSMVFALIYLVIAVIVNLVFTLPAGDNTVLTQVLTFVSYLLLLPIAYGFVVAFLGQARKREIQLGDLFAHFNGRIWITMILKNVYIFLWTLLLIIPGIIKEYSYAMTEYVLADNPELSGNAAIEKSMEMMQGNKWRLFLLDLSFIGWMILSILTLGIAMFWVLPYMIQTHAAFYETLKAETAVEEVAEIEHEKESDNSNNE